jgi:hypothetical protein
MYNRQIKASERLFLEHRSDDITKTTNFIKGKRRDKFGRRKWTMYSENGGD